MKRNWITPALLGMFLAAPGAYFSIPARAATPGHGVAAMQDRDDWQRPPDSYNDAQRQGFREGLEAARRDWEHHRRKDADDHRAYRRPPVPREMRDAYRDGFRHGYDAGMRHMGGDHHDDDHPGL